jgi:hypothetical protein
VSFGHQVDAGNHPIGLGATAADQQHTLRRYRFGRAHPGHRARNPRSLRSQGAVAGLHGAAGGVMQRMLES